MDIMKRVLSAFLAVVLVFGMLPATAFASEGTDAIAGETEPLVTEPQVTEPQVTEPVVTEPQVTEPPVTEPQETEPQVTEPPVTEPQETEPPVTEPLETEPQVTEPPATEPQETEPQETEPQETEPQETEPEKELERVPLEPQFFDWFLKENIHRENETITVVEQVGADAYHTSEITREKVSNSYAVEEVYDYPMTTMAVRGVTAPTTFTSFDELKSILRQGYTGDLVLTYKGTDVLEIREDLTIPENVTILTDNTVDEWEYAHYDMEGTAHLSVLIPAGVTLTVNGSLQVAGLKQEGDLNVNGFVKVIRGIHIPQFCGAVIRLNGRNLYLDPGCRYDIDLSNVYDLTGGDSDVYYWHDVIETKDQFVAEMAAIEQHWYDNSSNDGWIIHRVLVQQSEHFQLDTDVSITPYVRMLVTGGYGITVEEGATLYNYSNQPVDLEVPLQINGTLCNEGNKLYVMKTPNGGTVFSSTGTYTGSGKLRVSKFGVDAWTDVVQGLDPTVYMGVEGEEMYAWILEEVNGRSILPAPKNLAWNKKVENGNVVNQPGYIYWEASESDSDSYYIKIFNADTGMLVRNSWYTFGDYDDPVRRSFARFLYEALPSGNYYFTVATAVHPSGKDGYSEENWLPSEAVKSPVWKYTKPSKTIGTPTSLSISWPLLAWNVPANATANTMYAVEYYFAPNLDQQPRQMGYSSEFTGNYNQIWPGLGQDCGKGYYSFRVRALSENVTQKCTGAWSELSAPYYYDPEEEITWADESFFQANVDLSTGYIRVDQPVILKNDFTIPQNTYLDIAGNGSVTVPEGVTLTIIGGANLFDYGSLKVMPGGTLNIMSFVRVGQDGTLQVVDGDVNFGNNGWVEKTFYNGNLVYCTIEGIPDDRMVVQVRIDGDSGVNEQESALNFFENHQENGFAAAGLSIQADVELTQDLIVPQSGQVFVELYSNATLTVPEGIALSVRGELYVFEGSTLENNGNMLAGGQVQIAGTLENNGTIHVRTLSGSEQDAILNVQPGGTVVNNGSVVQYYGASVQCAKGGTWIGAAATDAFAAFKNRVATASANNEGVVYLEDTVVLSENFAIPRNLTLIMEEGSHLVVPSGKTLTMNGCAELRSAALHVEEGGTLILNQFIELTGTDSLRVDGTIECNGEGTVYRRLSDETPADMPYEISGVSADLFAQRILLDNWMDENTALAAFTDSDRETFGRRILLVHKDLHVSNELTVPDNGILHVSQGNTLSIGPDANFHNYGSVYVWEDNRLENDGNVWNRGGINIYGELQNSGKIDLAYDEYTSWGPYLWIAEPGLAENNGEVATWPDTEVWIDGRWTGNPVAVRGGNLGGDGTINGESIMMTTSQLLNAMSKVSSGYSYNLENKVVYLTGSTVTLTKQLNVCDGSVLYVPEGTTLNVKGNLLLTEGGTVIVEAGGKLVNSSNIFVYSREEEAGALFVDGTYSSAAGASLMVDYYYNEEISAYTRANVIGVEMSEQTLYTANPDESTFRDMLNICDYGTYAGVFMEIEDMTFNSPVFIPRNATVIINGNDVHNDTVMEVEGHVWVNAPWDHDTGVNIPAEFLNTGDIILRYDGCLTVSGHVQNNGNIRAEIAGQIERRSDFSRTWDGKDPVFVGGQSNYYGNDGTDDAWAMTQDAFIKMLNNKNVKEITLDKHVVISKNVTINKPVTVGPNGALLVMNGATLTVNNELAIREGGDLVVYGGSHLANNHTVWLDTMDNEYESGVVCIYGGYSGYMLSAMMNRGEPNIVDTDMSGIRAVFWDNGTEYTLVDVLYMDLQNRYGMVNYHLTGDVENPTVVSEDITIPQGFLLSMSPFADLELNGNVTLYGEIYTDRFYADRNQASNVYINGTMYTKNDSWIGGSGRIYNNGTVYQEYSAGISDEIEWIGPSAIMEGMMSYAEFKTGLEEALAAGTDYELTSPVILEENLVAESPIIHVKEGGHIIVPNGKTLKVNGVLYVEGGRITVHDGGTLQVTGNLQIADGGIVITGPKAVLKNSGNITVNAGAELYCQGTYQPAGAHYVFRNDANYYNIDMPEDFWLEFSGVVSGIPESCQVLPNISIDTYDPYLNGYSLVNVVNSLRNWGFMGAQISVPDVCLQEDLILPDRFELFANNVEISDGVTLQVSGPFSADSIVNNGTLILNKGAEASLKAGTISGNAPVFNGAHINPDTSGITVSPVNPEVTVMEGNSITIEGHDAVYRDEEGNVLTKLNISVDPATYDFMYNEQPLEYVTFTSSNKAVLNPANIVRNEDGTYSLNNLGVGTTNLTITSMAALQDTTRRGGDGKLTAQQATTTLTITVTPVKADHVVLIDVDSDMPLEEKILAKTGEPQTFDVIAEIYDVHGRTMPDKQVIWSVSDKKLAGIKDLGNGVAQVTIPANVDGIALITAQVADQKDIAASMDVNIRDLAPRLSTGTIGLNPYVIAGTTIDLVQSYDNIIRSVAIDHPGLNVKYSDDKLTVTAKDYTMPKQSIKNTLLHVLTDAGEYIFRVTVNVAPAYPKVTAKQAGKLDLFYTDSQQALNVTASGAVVAAIRMEGTTDFDLTGNVLSFSEYLKSNYSTNTRYKPDTTVNLYAALEGYYGEVLVKKNFKISTTTSKKSLQILTSEGAKPGKLVRFLAADLNLAIYEKVGKVLNPVVMDSITTADAYATISQQPDGNFLLGCGDNLRSRTVKLNLQQENWMRPVQVSFKLTVDNSIPTVKPKATTLNLNSILATLSTTDITTTMADWSALQISIDRFDPVKPSAATENMQVSYYRGAISAILWNGATPANGTYAFRGTPTAVNAEGETVSLKPVTINVKVSNTKPVVKPAKATLTLNSNFPGQMESCDYTVTMIDKSGVYMGDFVAVKPNAETEKITVQSYNGEIVASIRDGEIPRNGTYTFKTTPEVVASNDEFTPIGDMKINVKVVNTKPTVKLGATTVKLNTILAEGEIAEIPVTIRSNAGIRDLYLKNVIIDNPYEDDKVHVKFNDGKLRVNLKDGAPKGTYKIGLIPVVAGVGGEMELSRMTLTVSAYTKAPTVTAKASGKLDTLNRDVGMRYTITKVSNVLNGLNGLMYAVLEDGVYDNNLFEAANHGIDAKGNLYFDVLLKDGETYDLKRTYQIQVTYNVWGEPVVARYKFKVTQPTVKAAAVSPVTFYQSAGEPLNVRVNLASPAYADIQRIEFNKAKSSRELAAALGYTANTEVFWESGVKSAEFGLNFIRLGGLKNGATYNLVLDVYPVGHAVNAKLTQVTVKVKIVK